MIFTLFDTAIGDCAIVWESHGVTGLQLPEADPGRARARLRRRLGAVEGPAPAEIRDAISDIVGLLDGEPRDLSAVDLEMGGVQPCDRRVYEVARTIAPGETLTYGELARRVAGPEDARDVGRALGRNPFPIVVPCHRVVAAGGRIGGFSARGGVSTKLRMLEIEARHRPGTLAL